MKIIWISLFTQYYKFVPTPENFDRDLTHNSWKNTELIVLSRLQNMLPKRDHKESSLQSYKIVLEKWSYFQWPKNNKFYWQKLVHSMVFYCSFVRMLQIFFSFWEFSLKVVFSWKENNELCADNVERKIFANSFLIHFHRCFQHETSAFAPPPLRRRENAIFWTCRFSKNYSGRQWYEHT